MDKNEKLQEIFKHNCDISQKRDKDITKVTETYISDGVELEVDIFLPNKESFPDMCPGILWFFGGGFILGCKENFEPQAIELARQGYVALCPSYRIRALHGTSPKESIIDGVAVWMYMRENAERWNLAIDRIAISGGSAGALIAAMAGPVSGIFPLALVLLSPAVNFHGVKNEILHEIEDWDINGISLPSVDTLRPGMPSMLILHGEDDPTIPVANVLEYAARGKELGIDVKTVIYPGANHGFISFNQYRPYYFMTLGEILLFLNRRLGGGVQSE